MSEENKSLDNFILEVYNNMKYAQEIFYSENFLEKYSIEDEKIIKLYNRLKLESDKTTAFNDFLVMLDLKEPPRVSYDKNKINIKLKAFENKKIRYKLPIKVKGNGDIDITARVKYPVDWLELQNNEYKGVQTIDGQIFEIYCIIDTNLIKQRKTNNVIIIEDLYGSMEIEIDIKREKLLIVETDKQQYKCNDKGFLRVYNNTGEDLMIEVISSQSWLKFASKKFLIPNKVDIPFKTDIRTGVFTKIPEYMAILKVNAFVKGKPIGEKINIKVIDK